MPRISSYPTITPTGSDLVLISDASATGNPTKTATVSSINALNNEETLQDVLDNNNTAVEDINLTGNIALTGNLTGTGNVTRTGNVILTGAQTISTTLSVTGTTTLGVLSLSSVSGGWTNAGNTIADLGTVTTVDINGGTVDGANVGGNVAATGTFTTLTGTTIDGSIGSVTPAAGVFTLLSPNDIECGDSLTVVGLSTLGTVDVNGGDIDGTDIGVAVPAAGSFTTITGSGNLTVDTDTLFVDATANRVGIGTTTPNNTLELESSSGDIIIELDNNAAGSSNFQIQCGAGNARADLVLDNNLHVTMKGQRVGIINTNPAYTLDVLGDGYFSSDFRVDGTTTLIGDARINTTLRIPTTAPASDSATGTAGMIVITNDYIYICTAINTWRRIQVTGSGW